MNMHVLRRSLQGVVWRFHVYLSGAWMGPGKMRGG